MRNDSRRKALLFFLLLVIAFPLLQQDLAFYESGRLRGAITAVADPRFSLHTWWDGSFQQQKNAYLNDSTGCRPDLVRMNNEVDLWLFGKLHANGVVLGKDDYLFEKFYIDEYCGLDFMGNDVIRNEIMKLKKVQDTLERLGKTFVFFYAPSKAYYYPDKFPHELECAHPALATNYGTFKKMGDSAGLNQADFNGWFLSMKDTSKNLLFSRLGTHWTVYGAMLAIDSVIKYVETKRNIRMPEWQWNEVEYSDKPRASDDDLAVGLNLISHFKKERFSYPRCIFNTDSTRTKPKTIFIGDSFLWTLSDNGLMHCVDKDWDFWYYFKEAWNQHTFSGEEPVRQVSDIDWQTKLLHTDCVIVLYTPANFKGFNYSESFVEKMYGYFYPGGKI